MSRRPAGAIDAAIAVLIRVLGAGLVFALQVLLARLLPGADYGGFVTLWTWMLALGSFAAMGFAESSVRFMPRYHLRNRQAALLGYWRFGLLVVVIGGLSLPLLALGLWGSLGGNAAAFTLVLVGLGLPFLGLEYYLEGVARSMGWFRLAAVPVYVLRPILIGATCLGLAGAGVQLSLPVVGAVLIAAMALIALLMWVLVGRRLGMARMAAPPATGKQKRIWLLASLPLLLLSGLEDLTSYADILVLSLLAEPEVVGIYFAAARALALAGFVAYAMTLVSGQKFAVDLAFSDRHELQQSILQSTRLTLWATIASVGLALIASPWLLGAFGGAYLAGQGVMVVLGFGMILRAMSGQAAEALLVLGRQREGLILALGVVVVMTTLALVLVPWLGALGAALASAVAMGCRTLALILVLWRTDQLRVFSLSLPALAWR